MLQKVLFIVLLAAACLAQQLRGRQTENIMNDIEYSSFLQFQTDTPPMDLMLTNHEYEIYKMMGVPGVVMMNYRFEETPYSPSDW